MCKGDVFLRFIDESRCSVDENASQCVDYGSTPFSFVAYVGDGPNDFCPMLKLGPSDLASIFNAHLTRSYLIRCIKGLSHHLTLAYKHCFVVILDEFGMPD